MDPVTMSALAQGTGAGLEFIGGLMDRNTGISLKTLRRRGRQSIAQARASDAVFGGLEEAALRTAHQKELAGFEGAKRSATLAGQHAQRMVQEQGAVNRAQAEQSIVGRGLAGTSTGAQVFGGVQDQTTRQLASIDMQLAQTLSQLGLDQAATEGAQGREIAGLRRNSRDFNRELEQFYTQLMTSGNITK